MKHSKVAIIGAGPAGIACAVQLKRYGIKPFLFEKNQTGGLLRNAHLVENYLGFEAGISGHELVEKFRKNLADLDIEPIFSEVKKVYFSESNFIINTNNGLFLTRFLVVASGTTPIKLQIPMKPIFQDKLFYEIANCKQPIMDRKKIAIIGAGDAAFDYAINLVNNYNVSEVVIINRNDKAKCLSVLEKRAEKTKKIKHIKNINVEYFKETDEKIVLSCIEKKNRINIEADYIIPAIGREPCLDFLDKKILKSSLSLQKEGLLYFIGDVANDNYRQISIATGDGIKIAMKIHSKLNTMYL